MLEDVYKSYRKLADLINWNGYSINDLFYKCIENENTQDYEKFYAGIICRVWGYAGRVYLDCNKHVSFEECYDCLIDTINYVLKNRVWENPSSSLYNDPFAPDKAFHIVLKRQRGLMLAKLTTHKRQSNFNTLSIDNQHEEYNDSADGLLFNLPSSEENLSIISFIVEFFNKDMYLEGLFLDSICFNIDDFDYMQTIRFIKNIDISCYEYYEQVYGIDYHKFTEILKYIKITKTQVLLRKLKGFLFKLRKDYYSD